MVGISNMNLPSNNIMDLIEKPSIMPERFNSDSSPLHYELTPDDLNSVSEPILSSQHTVEMYF